MEIVIMCYNFDDYFAVGMCFCVLHRVNPSSQAGK